MIRLDTLMCGWLSTACICNESWWWYDENDYSSYLTYIHPCDPEAHGDPEMQFHENRPFYHEDGPLWKYPKYI